MADHRATSRRALEAFNTGEFDSLEGVYTADCVVHDSQNVFAVDQHGLDVLRGQVSMFRAASPNLKMTIEAQYEDGHGHRNPDRPLRRRPDRRGLVQLGHARHVATTRSDPNQPTRAGRARLARKETPMPAE